MVTTRPPLPPAQSSSDEKLPSNCLSRYEIKIVGCPSSGLFYGGTSGRRTRGPKTGVTDKLNAVPMLEDVQYVVRNAGLDTERHSCRYDVNSPSNRLNNWLTSSNGILLEKLVVS
jgi:hypothetical protein